MEDEMEFANAQYLAGKIENATGFDIGMCETYGTNGHRYVAYVCEGDKDWDCCDVYSISHHGWMDALDGIASQLGLVFEDE
jgi:hypothetical protein